MIVDSAEGKKRLIALALLVLVIAAYGRVGHHGFVGHDDGQYVYENPQVRSGLTLRGISWAFTTTYQANWHPLTWLSHMADVQMFGLEAGWHHRMNVVIHALNAVLLCLVLTGMTGAMWRSAMVAALFAVHPVHVESVAWAAERKDVLSTFFWLLTMGLYAGYVRRPGGWRYLGVTLSFVLGLLSKPMLVTLPFVLLLLDFWPLGRLASREPPVAAAGPMSRERNPRPVLEKVPLLLLAAGSSLVTYLAQASKAAVPSLENLPLADRISNALISYVLYLAKTVWPTSLAVFYPHPSSIGERIPMWQPLLAAIVLAELTLLALSYGRLRPYLAVGWLWYLGTLVPVIGIVQVGSQAMADRYTYVPLIGIFIAIVWGVAELLGRWRYRRPVLAALSLAVILVLSLATWLQTAYWRDNASLFARAIAVTRKNWLAWNSLGTYHLEHGDARRAIASYQEALRFDPTYAEAWINRGVAHEAIGQYQQAIACYEAALRLGSVDDIALYNLVLAYSKQGSREKALEAHRRLQAIDPAKAEELLRAMGEGR